MNRELKAKLDRAVAAHHNVDLKSSIVGDEAATLWGHKMTLDADGEIHVAGEKDFDTFLASEIEKRPHWQLAPVDTSAEEEALRTGSLKAHGDLFKSLGEVEYNAWKSRTGAEPGKPAAHMNGATPTPSPQNPFSKAGWNISKQGALYAVFEKAHGKEKALAKLSELARAAGVTVGATKGLY